MITNCSLLLSHGPRKSPFWATNYTLGGFLRVMSARKGIKKSCRYEQSRQWSWIKAHLLYRWDFHSGRKKAGKSPSWDSLLIGVLPLLHHFIIHLCQLLWLGHVRTIIKDSMLFRSAWNIWIFSRPSATSVAPFCSLPPFRCQKADFMGWGVEGKRSNASSIESWMMGLELSCSVSCLSAKGSQVEIYGDSCAATIHGAVASDWRERESSAWVSYFNGIAVYSQRVRYSGVYPLRANLKFETYSVCQSKGLEIKFTRWSSKPFKYWIIRELLKCKYIIDI